MKADWGSADTPDKPCAKGGANGVDNALPRLASTNTLRRRCGLPACVPHKLTHSIWKSRFINATSTASQNSPRKRKLSTFSRNSIGTSNTRARRITSHTKLDSDPYRPRFLPALDKSIQGNPATMVSIWVVNAFSVRVCTSSYKGAFGKLPSSMRARNTAAASGSRSQ